MAVWEGKKYKLEKSENFDEYLQAFGVGYLVRKMMGNITSTVELSKEDTEYTFTTSSTFKTRMFKFTPDVEFDEETPDGRKIKSICKFENPNKFIHEQKGEYATINTREFTPSELITTMSIGDVKCTRLYKAV